MGDFGLKMGVGGGGILNLELGGSWAGGGVFSGEKGE